MKIFFFVRANAPLLRHASPLGVGLFCVAHKLFVAQAFDINRVVVRGKEVCAVSFSIFLFIFV